MGVSPNCNPYSRAQWTELQLRFRPPRDSLDVSVRLRDYGSPEEIDVVVVALQLLRRELSARRQLNSHEPHVRRGAGCCPGRHVGCL